MSETEDQLRKMLAEKCGADAVDLLDAWKEEVQEEQLRLTQATLVARETAERHLSALREAVLDVASDLSIKSIGFPWLRKPAERLKEAMNATPEPQRVLTTDELRRCFVRMGWSRDHVDHTMELVLGMVAAHDGAHVAQPLDREALGRKVRDALGDISTACETKDLRWGSKEELLDKQRKVIEYVHSVALNAYKAAHDGAHVAQPLSGYAPGVPQFVAGADAALPTLTLEEVEEDLKEVLTSGFWARARIMERLKKRLAQKGAGRGDE